ncbi:MAG: asparagine--tRNA ligase [Candidatus Nitronauta litoralis]|uniref:Asparagine--tRNA ligase n=1 Tax=Candidatus Nitronauta litoralis TaxID=2705533 RepID=A0A7T0BTA2_9BACT|nr:MAG: asparagine--tRNA ligase [Candidatus Nitronauta litoralis]
MTEQRRTPIKQLLTEGRAHPSVTVQGWVRTRRDSKGGFSFIELNDGSCLKNLQIIADHTLVSYQNQQSRIHTGACIQITGELVESEGKGQSVEMRAAELSVFGEADPEHYPLQKKRHSLEYLREIAHLRPRTNTIGAVMRVRSRLAYAVHQFFVDKGFVYLHTPIITSSDCEGAGEMFQVTTLDINNPPRSEDGVDFKEDFFGERTGLTVSGQLEGEIYAMALSLIYTFGPTFRAENSHTSRHLSEFWMIEPEMAFYDLEDDMDLAEEFIKYLLNDVLEHCHDDLEFFNQRVDKHLLETLTHVNDTPFEHISYTEAVDLLKKSKHKFEYPVEWGGHLQSEHERHLAETIFLKPVIIFDYPEKIKPFYMKMNEDGKTVRAMDVLLPRLGEIIGGSQREDDYEVLKSRFDVKGIDPKEYWWYLDLRRFGSAPHSGFGMGFERMVQFATGVENIRDVIPFPRFPKHAKF